MGRWVLILVVPAACEVAPIVVPVPDEPVPTPLSGSAVARDCGSACVAGIPDMPDSVDPVLHAAVEDRMGPVVLISRPTSADIGASDRFVQRWTQITVEPPSQTERPTWSVSSSVCRPAATSMPEETDIPVTTSAS